MTCSAPGGPRRRHGSVRTARRCSTRRPSSATHSDRERCRCSQVCGRPTTPPSNRWRRSACAFSRTAPSATPAFGTRSGPCTAASLCAPPTRSNTAAADRIVPGGRIRRGAVTTCSNVAKFAPFHSCAIFDHHEPMLATEHATDVVAVADEYLAHVRRASSRPLRLLIGWNCMACSGASLEHGHAQLLCLPHAPRWAEDLEADAGAALRDMISVAARTDTLLPHSGTGCCAFVSLSPGIHKEVLVAAPAPGEAGGELGDRVGNGLRAVLRAMRSEGTTAFNVVVTSIHAPKSGIGGPRGSVAVARVGDRGPHDRKTAGFGFVEALQVGTVGGTDPFAVAAGLRRRLT
eukprot:TRINITY_DN15850_c0_g1_i1.p1 TRINITY_DN15850_c0_g1~~TRINITY_DN15850_c0_g1_i1.p1  ORF type:complete len:347 (+),score=33.01 TRINITY_DN15850_c0_g1_i1:128-1168(+)